MSQVNKEFDGPSELTAMDRRDFVRYMGMLSSMSFLASCSRPAENIYPFSREIKEFATSNTEIYSSLINQEGFAQGITVKSFQGRPIKIEGNKNHPFSVGATTPRAQAAMYELYHPDRLQDVRWKKEKLSVKEASQKLKTILEDRNLGEGLAFIFPPDHSPTTNSLIKDIQKKYPKSLWLSLSPWKRTEYLNQDLSDKKIVVSFDEDIFYQRPDALKLAHEFMGQRKKAIQENRNTNLNELIVWESSPTLAGAKAGSRKTISRAEIWNTAVELNHVLKGKSSQNVEIQKLAAKLKKSTYAIFLDHTLHPDAKDLEAELNGLKPKRFELPETTTFDDLMEKISQGEIKTLISWDVDPLRWHPQMLELWKKIPLKIHLSLFATKTAKLADVSFAREHFLECWSDLSAPDGSVSIQQPLIKPMYHGISPLSFLSLMLGRDQSSYEIIFHSYKENLKVALAEGFTSGESRASLTPKTNQYLPRPQSSGFTIKIKPDFSVGYGEGFKNPVLQELPKAFSRLTWQNSFFISPSDAEELKVKNGSIVEVIGSRSKVSAPIWILPYLASKTILAPLGYGEDKRGFNAYKFSDGESITIKKTIRTQELAVVQENLFPESRSPIQATALPAELNKKKEVSSFYPENPNPVDKKLPQWGMSIDLETCIGCEACVISCQVENNIPFVGEDQVKKGRILHWLRVDTYHVNDKTFFQPVPCMHCEKAPCEVVCPVNATVHDSSGINEMVYNRCVGTRYCSNNCPYRVRKFNFKAYSVLKAPYSLGFNPDVSVRDRGVMEKCTYCIQRLIGGNTVTACQQVCPTQSIQFGNILEKSSMVVQEKNSPRNYLLLEEEGARPRTSYLKVINHEIN